MNWKRVILRGMVVIALLLTALVAVGALADIDMGT